MKKVLTATCALNIVSIDTFYMQSAVDKTPFVFGISDTHKCWTLIIKAINSEIYVMGWLYCFFFYVQNFFNQIFYITI